MRSHYTQHMADSYMVYKHLKMWKAVLMITITPDLTKVRTRGSLI